MRFGKFFPELDNKERPIVPPRRAVLLGLQICSLHLFKELRALVIGGALTGINAFR